MVKATQHQNIYKTLLEVVPVLNSEENSHKSQEFLKQISVKYLHPFVCQIFCLKIIGSIHLDKFLFKNACVEILQKNLELWHSKTFQNDYRI